MKQYPECLNCEMKENCTAPDCRVWQENNNYGIHDDETLEEAIFSLEYEIYYRK